MPSQACAVASCSTAATKTSALSGRSPSAANAASTCDALRAVGSDACSFFTVKLHARRRFGDTFLVRGLQGVWARVDCQPTCLNRWFGVYEWSEHLCALCTRKGRAAERMAP